MVEHRRRALRHGVPTGGARRCCAPRAANGARAGRPSHAGRSERAHDRRGLDRPGWGRAGGEGRACRGGVVTAGQARIPVRDAFQRPLRDLRVSVTDRCNFRCQYCMPAGSDACAPYLGRNDILAFEEIARLVRTFARLGVEKVRLTGGEPLLRNGLPDLITMLSDGPALDIALTTNGSLLALLAEKLKRAGLQRVTVSLDSLDERTFQAMNGASFPVGRVLEGIAAAAEAGLAPIKINTVVIRGVNDGSVVELARWFKGTRQIVRFIEYMDAGNVACWSPAAVVPGAEIVRMIGAELPLEPAEANYRGEVAQRWRYADGEGEIGVITSVSQAFCGDCTRGRLSADGVLYTCLFSHRGLDLGRAMRSGANDAELEALICGAWSARTDRYSELRSRMGAKHEPRIEMSYIGG
ncbi:MAG: GTP 3',8-cyclase MoaA [Chloroflexi bacterium]|nr:GTP 3',8-cyclase MoaA [Chloroflexota bacterium]